MMYKLSLLLRKIKSRKRLQAVTATFAEDKSWIAAHIQRPEPGGEDNLLIIRLDDIGDYVLFRNMLPYYSAMYPHRKLFLLGNVTWKGLFEAVDAIHDITPIWVDKKQYFKDPAYRQALWQRLADLGFTEVIAPSVSRNVLLDDLCVMAAGAVNNTGVGQLYEVPELLALSRGLYTSLVNIPRNIYEFGGNRLAAEIITGKLVDIKKPYLPKLSSGQQPPSIGLFIGANAVSRRWSNEGWKDLIAMLRRQYPAHTILILGGPDDTDSAAAILEGFTGDGQVVSRAGTLALPDTISLIQQLDLLVSNNSMAYHVGMASGIPTVIITSGENPYRFTTFNADLFPDVRVVYPERFKAHWQAYTERQQFKFEPVKADIQGIPAATVMAAAREVFR